MDTFEPLPSLERNPVTHARHRREVFWQITLPLLLVVVLCLALSALVFSAPWGDASHWADVSTIWLIFLTFLPGLILTLILAGFAALTFYLLRKLPGLFYKLYGFTLKVGAKIDQLGNRVVEPVLRVHSFQASLRALSRLARRR